MHCGHCGEEATQRCGGCKSTLYCTPECQQADWRLHKLVCKQWAQFQTRPSEDVRRVILLPERDGKPVFFWMPIKLYVLDDGSYDDDDDDLESMNQGLDTMPKGARIVGDTVFGTSDSTPQCKMLMNKAVGGGKLLDHTIFLAHLDYFLDRAPNPSLASMAGAQVAKRWRGPLVICASGPVKHDDPIDIRDIDLSAFTLALNRISHYQPGINIPIIKTSGIKLNTTAPFIEEIRVPLKHPIFKSGSPIPIMELFKTSVRTHKYPVANPTNSTSKAVQSDPNFPLDPAALRICIDTSSPDFGKVPASFNDDDASVLLVCTDKLPCKVRTFLPTVACIKDYIVPKLAGAQANKESREEVWQEFVKEYEASYGRVVGN